MELEIFQDVPQREREQYLKDNAVKSEVYTYNEPLELEEISKNQTEFTQKSIELDIEQTNLKDITDGYKSKMNRLKSEMKSLMQLLRTGSKEITEEVYQLSDFDTQQMGYYNKKGILVFSRPLLKSEKQYSIMSNLKKVSE